MNALSTQFAEIRKGLFSRKSLQLDIEKSDLIAIQVDREDTRLMSEQSNAERRLTALVKEERDQIEKIEKARTRLEEEWVSEFTTHVKSNVSCLQSGTLPGSSLIDIQDRSVVCSITFEDTKTNKPLPKTMTRRGRAQLANPKLRLSCTIDFTEDETAAPSGFVSLHEELYILQEHITNAKNDLMNIRRQRANIGTMERKARVALATGILKETGPEGAELLKLLDAPQQPLPPTSTGKLVGEVVLDPDPLNS